MQIRVLMCGPIAASGGVSTHTKYLTKFLKKENVNVELFNLSAKDVDALESTAIRKAYQRTIGLFIEAYTNKDQYDLIHIQASGGLGGFIPAISAVLISKTLNKKYVATFHYSQTEEFVNRYSKVFGFVLKNVNKMIVVSNKQKRVISEIFPQYSEKINVIENGYDSALFFPLPKTECRAKLGLPLDKKIIINAANLIQTKGHLYLIDAMDEVVKQRKDVLLIIAGDGYMKKSIIERVKELKLEEYIKLVGNKNHEEIPIWMNSSDLFVLPSLNESFGIVTIEAMACSKPVVATYNGGSEGILTSPGYGYLVQPRNSAELANKIIEALEKDWNHRKIQSYAQQFVWDKVAQKTLKIYSGILS